MRAVTVLLAATIAALVDLGSAQDLDGQDDVSQYREALTRIFLWRYQALPLI
jgi:hypothetical protein